MWHEKRTDESIIKKATQEVVRMKDFTLMIPL